MRVYFRAQYLTSAVGQMRRADYNATLLVHAVKGKSINSSQYAHVKIGGSSVMITDGNKDRAMDWFGEWAAQYVRAQGWGPKVLVPIPNRSAVIGSSAAPRTALIAHAVRRATSGAVVVADVLRWKRQLPKSTDIASRRPEVLLPDLVLTGKLPVGTVVLVDDVFTSGGHAVASAWRLADQLKIPSCVISCGRTLHEQLPDPFAVPDEELIIPKRP
ncbi:hypothetical protein X753_21310 [Mesorhizobium sp. LNJC399B00]|uniref:phosphoribosyltransferase n=1 Tax=unclassified Mesorhizobium TaxID=325217 RepID=UPI0003CE0142|nr:MULTISPECIES: phosphoribosyltransferase [unclassified Mesorhizobium]ESY03893.1 hypothetical protein X753_21310 [Mesorhizobium sp. LNJC399B00]WJI68864.1 phosphoribosyltransferase [Mesorhizobium sp. C399B]